MRFLGIIPARYGSTRFPAKPLADMGGKMVIQRVFEQVKESLDEVYVATDDQRIIDAVLSFGGKAVMTSVNHKSGTDRCKEAADKIGGDFDIIINIQGDEPFVTPDQIDELKSCFTDDSIDIATLVKPYNSTDDFDELFNPNAVKVVINKNNEALYFSRSIIPYQRGVDYSEWLKRFTYLYHVGLYAYKRSVLNEITSIPLSSLEMAESLEQLRWLEHGYKIKVGTTYHESIGIDTPEDLAKAIEILKKQEID